MRKKNDILLKSAFEEAFPDLLRFFFKNADLIFDMDRGFEFLDKELKELFPELERRGGARFVDMLVKTFGADGSEKWMLVHIEIQAQHDTNFGHRMFQYFYRIFDRYQVPITAISVFTGEKSQVCSSEFQYEFLGTTLQYKFNTYHIQDHSEQELLAMDNRFSLIILATQKTLISSKLSLRELAEHRFNIAKAMICSNKYSPEQIKRFMLFLKNYIFIENSKINIIFDKQIDHLTGHRNAMDLMEAIEIVMKQTAEENARKPFVIYLLKHTDMDLATIAATAEVDEDFVEEVEHEVGRKA